MGESFAESFVARLHDVAQRLHVLLLLADQRRHLSGLVVRVLVDDAQRADDRATAQAEVVAALGRVLLAVQRVGQVDGAATLLALHRLSTTTTTTPIIDTVTR